MEKIFFSHIPKCGGTWVSNALKNVHQVATSDAMLSCQRVQNHKHFGFIRSPWAWYVSWYNFNRHGSDIAPPSLITPDALALNGKDTFEEVLRAYCKPTSDFKRKLWNSTHHLPLSQQQSSHFRIAGQWIDSSNSFLEHLYDIYLCDAEFIGKTENAEGDLKRALQLFGLLTPTVEYDIDSTPRIQVGRKVDYRTYYTDETAQLVFDTHQRIITKHNYNFEGL